MNRMKYYSTEKLGTYVRSLYARLEPLAKKDGVYRQIDEYFDTGTPGGRDGSFCYSDRDGYHYGGIERGELRTNVVTKNLSETVFWILSSDIFLMAVDYERAHRIKGQDFRRQMFQKRKQYWNLLGPEYAEQAEKEITDILLRSQFNGDLFK